MGRKWMDYGSRQIDRNCIDYGSRVELNSGYGHWIPPGPNIILPIPLALPECANGKLRAVPPIRSAAPH